MKVVSVTLAGGRREALIVDALKSVDGWVDEVILIDTIDAAAAIAQVKLHCSVPVRVVELSDRVRQNFCCGDARNEALDAAAAAGAEWAIMLDTDERIELRRENVRRLLESTPAEVGYILAWNTDGSYPKERAFRVPRRGAYDAHRVHESYQASAGERRAIFPRLRFAEVERSDEQKVRDNEIVLAAAKEQAAAEPGCARWQFYIADTTLALMKSRVLALDQEADNPNVSGETQAIIESRDAFDASAGLETDPEARAWSSVRAAYCCGLLHDFDGGLGRCSLALASFAGMPEAATMAAHLNMAAHRFEQALIWCQIAISLGRYRGCGGQIGRIGFADPEASWEQPFEIMAGVMRCMGRTREAESLDSTATLAREKRLAEHR